MCDMEGTRESSKEDSFQVGSTLHAWKGVTRRQSLQERTGKASAQLLTEEQKSTQLHASSLAARKSHPLQEGPSQSLQVCFV